MSSSSPISTSRKGRTGANDGTDNVTSSIGAPKPLNRIDSKDLPVEYEGLLQRFTKLANERDQLIAAAERRQESFLRKETQYKDEMAALEERVKNMGKEELSKMGGLRSMHSNIQETIGAIQSKTARILQDQERDLIRAFRARLADVTVELENERKKNESGSAEWVARCRKLTEELEWLRDLTDKLTAENKSVLKENRRFKRQMKTQEEDREFLIKQLVSVKKENARLRYSFDQAHLVGSGDDGIHGSGAAGGALLAASPSLSKLKSGGGSGSASVSASRPFSSISRGSGDRPASALFTPSSTLPLPFRAASAMSHNRTNINNNNNGNSASYNQAFRSVSAMSMRAAEQNAGGAINAGNADGDERSKKMILKQQRLLEEANKKYRSLRTQYTNEIAARTELQNFLKKCIDDVREDISARQRVARVQASGAGRNRLGVHSGIGDSKPPLDPRDIPLSHFTPQDRINVMEWLLSQDQVIFMLYDKMFPKHGVRANLDEMELKSSISAHLQQRAGHVHQQGIHLPNDPTTSTSFHYGAHTATHTATDIHTHTATGTNTDRSAATEQNGHHDSDSDDSDQDVSTARNNERPLSTSGSGTGRFDATGTVNTVTAGGDDDGGHDDADDKLNSAADGAELDNSYSDRSHAECKEEPAC